MKVRGFEKITKYAAVEFSMPERKTQKSAGYDICLPEDIELRQENCSWYRLVSRPICRMTNI